MNIDTIYKTYHTYVSNVNDIYTNFKNSSEYTYMLEHVSENFGNRYALQIKTEFNKNISEYLDLIQKNDSIGNPSKFRIDGINLSPSNTRYIYHSLLIKSKIKNWFEKSNIKIIEIGGGYGGLSFYIKNILSDYNIDYTIIDLPNAGLLQTKYLTDQCIDCNIKSCFDLKELEKTNYDLVISNYCLSEISDENRNLYFEYLIKNCSKEFYAWNTSNFSPLNTDNYIIEDERPVTRSNGLYFIYSK